MAERSLHELEEFLAGKGIELTDRAFELELNSYGWRVDRERRTRDCVVLKIACVVECDESIPRSLTVRSDPGQPDRDVALMRSLELVLDYGFVRDDAPA